MIKDARLMRADQLCRLRIPPMPGVTGEEYLGVGSDQRVGRVAQRHHSGKSNHMLWFVESNYLTGSAAFPAESPRLSAAESRIRRALAFSLPTAARGRDPATSD